MNTTALLSMGLAKCFPDLVGVPVHDSVGKKYPSITRVPVIIMKAKSVGKLKAAFKSIQELGMTVVAFFEHSRSLKTYEDYEASMRQTRLDDLQPSGFGVIGSSQALKPQLKKFSLWK
ncbi:MAG: DUF2000 domain-containing protein [Deltaproteobacteria bacterium]|nr:DUF2000 domain-containing protein [Deltaproteobacteria bacterium]